MTCFYLNYILPVSMTIQGININLYELAPKRDNQNTPSNFVLMLFGFSR